MSSDRLVGLEAVPPSEEHLVATSHAARRWGLWEGIGAEHACSSQCSLHGDQYFIVGAAPVKVATPVVMAATRQSKDGDPAPAPMSVVTGASLPSTGA